MVLTMLHVRYVDKYGGGVGHDDLHTHESQSSWRLLQFRLLTTRFKFNFNSNLTTTIGTVFLGLPGLYYLP